MSISLTSAAADRVRSFLGRRGQGVGLRLSVKKTGCSGFAYVVNYADENGADDIVFEEQGGTVSARPRQPRLHRRPRSRLRQTGPQRGLPLPQPEREGRMRLRRKLHGLTA